MGNHCNICTKEGVFGTDLNKLDKKKPDLLKKTETQKKKASMTSK